MTEGPLTFAVHPNSEPASETVRAEILANPGFGKYHTDHMVPIDYSVDKGWDNARGSP